MEKSLQTRLSKFAKELGNPDKPDDTSPIVAYQLQYSQWSYTAK